MLVDANGHLHEDSAFRSFSFGEDCHLVSGFFYIPGLHAGEESVQAVQLALEETGRIPFDRMYGSYTYCIQRSSGEIFFFVSNSQLRCLYFGGSAAASSFAELLRHLGSQEETLSFDIEALCECYTLGNIYFRKTFVHQVTIPPNGNYIHVQNGVMEILDKGIGEIDGESSITDPRAYFSGLVHAASGQRVAQALTGGYDSRMIFAQLNGKLPSELFISMKSPDSRDIRCAKRAAAAGGRELKVYRMEKPTLTEGLLEKLMAEADWIIPLSLDGDCRTHQFRRFLVEEGFQMEFTGDGGVLHKDWEWMQDLPFYHRRHTNLRRFYHQRIAFERNTAALGPLLREAYSGQEERFIRQLRPYVRSINTQSYDMLYHYVSGDRRRSYNQQYSSSFLSFAPLMELDFLRYSYHLPRRKRFFYNFLRKMTTTASPEIARIPTNYGTTASSEPLYLLRDVFFQLVSYGRKAIRMTGRMLFHKSFLVDKTAAWSLEEELRCFPLAERAAAWAAKEGLLDKSVSPQTLPYPQLSRVVHMYMLAKHFHICVQEPHPAENYSDKK